ncbi:hypothetical protein [Neptunicella marina]|uniref:Alkaline phosphatase D n=1 Tax=Neptunicella marina TaxID=2125989 RepID=A0A8J6IXX5_9ALTE|nr:hypothetical protein [Neptunicella marina]MBC3767366.1 hypothetical protein [Neptunicella marina]
MSQLNLNTNTSKWQLVIHKVSATTAQVWVGSLFDDLNKPDIARVLLKHQTQEIRQYDINMNDWQYPFKQIHKRFFYLCEIDGLQPDKEYQVEFQHYVNRPMYGVVGWQKLRSGEFKTLPTALPRHKEQAFCAMLGSCFYEHLDQGSTAMAYKSLYTQAPAHHKPDIKFLVGDQVYLDIGIDTLSLVPSEVRQRVADDYAKHWQALGSVLNRGANWFLADDHEYWNDYPFTDSNIPTLWPLKVPKVKRAWLSTAKDGVERVQCVSPISTFSLGQDLSFCVLDARSYRSQTQFTDQKTFRQLLDWLQQLNSPGILVLPQILLNMHNSQERNLLSFQKQYQQLIQAIAQCGHDIVLLSGDVHYGRIAEVQLATQTRLIEVVSSPMSNLTGLNSIATDVAVKKPVYFPAPPIAGVSRNKVNYIAAVSTERPKPFLSYLNKRTREHFMTIAFWKQQDHVKMSVQAWRVRQRDSQQRPKADFKNDIEFSLR